MPYHVYFLASRKYGTLYIGVTNDLAKRSNNTGKGSARGSFANIAYFGLSMLRPMSRQQMRSSARNN